MFRAGIAQDWHLAKYHFWHTVMRLAWWGDVRLVKLHTYAVRKALRYSPFED